jgi:hypothetical protein
MAQPKEARLELRDSDVVRNEREGAAAWKASRERLAKLSAKYEKAKEAERLCAPTDHSR